MTKVIKKLKKHLPTLILVVLVLSFSFGFGSPVAAAYTQAQFEELLQQVSSGGTINLAQMNYSDLTKDQWAQLVDAVAANKGSEARSAGKESLKESASNIAKLPWNIIQHTIVAVVTFVTNLIISVEGFFLVRLSQILLSIVKYNDFVASPAVNIGWTLVRDVSNLFFVVVLLAIAIGTIIRVESYNFKKLLPKVIIMAILVNFSLTIAGLILDFAQVVMMTFVAGFSELGGSGNLAEVLHIKDMIKAAATTSTSGSWTEDVNIISAVATSVVAVIFLIIAILVVLVIVVVLVARMIILWLLLVLSPLAYILAAFPQGMKYAQQWWTEFTKYAIIGPVLAFFLWLAFAVVEKTGGEISEYGLSVDSSGTQTEFAGLVSSASTIDTQSASIFTGIGDVNNLLSLIIGIGMLLGGLMAAQQMGVAGGQFAGKVAGQIRQKGFAAVKAPVQWGLKRADDLQAGIQKTALNLPGVRNLAQSRFGRATGLDIMRREGGIKLRTIPDAWSKRAARVEAQRLGRGGAVTEDVFNRIIPLSKAKTDEARRLRAIQVLNEQKIVGATSTDSEEILDNMIVQDLDKKGRVKKGREIHAEAKLRELMTDHNPNELVFKMQEKFGNDFGKGLLGTARELEIDQSTGKIQYSTHNLQEAIRHMFSRFGEDLQSQIMFDAGEVGFANNDPNTKYMSAKDSKTGRFMMLTKDKQDIDEQGRVQQIRDLKTGEVRDKTLYDKQQELADRYYSKLQGRPFIQKYVWQNLIKEARVKNAQGETETVGTGIQEFGLIDLINNPTALVAEFHQAKPETATRLYENLDILADTEQVLKDNAAKSAAAGDRVWQEKFTRAANALNHLMRRVVAKQLPGKSRDYAANNVELSTAIQQSADEKRVRFPNLFAPGAGPAGGGPTGAGPAGGGPTVGPISIENISNIQNDTNIQNVLNNEVEPAIEALTQDQGGESRSTKRVRSRDLETILDQISDQLVSMETEIRTKMGDSVAQQFRNYLGSINERVYQAGLTGMTWDERQKMARDLSLAIKKFRPEEPEEQEGNP